MKLLVTGATGFIGRNLVKSLLDKNYKIHCIVRKESRLNLIDHRATLYSYNGDIENLLNYFHIEKFDGIVHLASLFIVNHTKKDIKTLISSNITFGTELLEVATLTDVKWFINTGTFWQHYNNEEYNPVNLYAATKEAFKKIAKFYVETSNIIFVTLELNDTFGPGDTRPKVLNLWNKIADTGEELKMSPGEQIMDICYIDDVLSAYELLIKHLTSNEAIKFKNESFVVTSKERITLKELSILFEEVTGKKLNINWGKLPYRKREVMIPWNKGKVVPGWECKVSLIEGLRKTFGIL